MIDKNQFERLQKLSCIKLDLLEKEKLLNQISDIVVFLDQLKKIDIKNSQSDSLFENTLDLISWVKNYSDLDWLLKNVKHKKLNGNIIIKSVLN